MTHHGRRHRKRLKPRIHRPSKPGQGPSALSAPPHSEHPVVSVVAYGPDEAIERQVDDLKSIDEYLHRYPVTWVNVDGLGDLEIIRELGELFGLHSLALEDVVHVHQRAKVEPYESHLFIVTRMVSSTEHLATEQLSMFLGRNYVLTFLEDPGDCLDPVRDRIRKNGGRIRRSGPDYLAYALIDSVIDSYFPTVERFADRLDEIEESVTTDQKHVIQWIHEIRNELLLLRRAVRPHREAVNELIRDEHPLIGPEARVFLRDCYDHTIQLIDLLEVYREMCADLRDFSISLASNRMNEIMKVLTIISTIFIPLGFIAGVYGMNFDTSSEWNMPELKWRFGYPIVLGFMALVSLALVGFFWRRGWIGSSLPPPPHKE